MVLHCAIHLERDPPVFSPGDVIQGVLVISSTWADKIHGINIKLAKKMEVEWDTYNLYDRNRISNVEDVTFLSECEIIENPNGHFLHPHLQNNHPSHITNNGGHNNVATASTSSSSTSTAASSSTANAIGVVPIASFTSKRGLVITRGVTHRYPFLLKIAYELDLPATFRGTYGFIAYKLVVFIKSPKKGIFIAGVKDIGIFPILDLNHLDISLQRPADHKRVFKSLFGYNYVFMKCHIDKRAFLPEELVSFTVEVTNKSPATLDGVEVHLNMSTHFAIYGASKIENRTLLRIRGPCISQGEHGIWAHSFNFPAVSLPTGLGALSKMRSKSIDLQYSLLFTLEVSKAEKFSIPFPIVIGTVPFGHNSRVVCMNHHMSAHSSTEGIADGGRRSGGNTPSSSSSSSVGGWRGSGNEFLRGTPEPIFSYCMRRQRPRSKSTSSLPPSYSSVNLQYQCAMARRAETPPPSYNEARAMMTVFSPL